MGTAPTASEIVAVTPPPDSMVSNNRPIAVVFSQPIDPATIEIPTPPVGAQKPTFQVSITNALGLGLPTPVKGRVYYDGEQKTAYFVILTPTDEVGRIVPNAEYTMTITDGVKDLNGNPVQRKQWKFTTGLAILNNYSGAFTFPGYSSARK